MKITRSKPESALLYCSFLGLEDDSDTPLAFPSIWNSCHHCKPIVGVNLDHQSNFCLSARHTSCPAYLQAPDQKLPDEIRIVQPSFSGYRFRQIFLPTLALLVVVIILGWFFAPDMFSALNLLNTRSSGQASLITPQSIQKTPSPSSIAVAVILTATEPSLSTLRPIITNPTMPAAIQITPTLLSKRNPHEIESLIGLNYIFRIHRAKGAEDIYTLAYENGTTAAAIVSINYIIKIPFSAQQLVVIPVYRKDVSELPLFEAYRVTEDTTIELLSTQLDVDPAQLQFYNGLGSYTQLYKGEWLVVPHEKKQAE